CASLEAGWLWLVTRHVVYEAPTRSPGHRDPSLTRGGMRPTAQYARTSPMAAKSRCILMGVPVRSLFAQLSNRRLAPGVVSVLMGFAVVGAALALSAVEPDKRHNGVAFVDSSYFRLWIGIAAFSVAVWIALLVLGCSMIRRLGLRWLDILWCALLA